MVVGAIGAGVLLGLVVLLAAPPLLKSSERGTTIGNIYAAVAMQTLGSPAISVSSNTKLRLKRRYFDEQYDSEKVTAGDVARRITKTPGSIGRWGRRAFTFVDEKYGSTFSLRDVLVGYREHELRKDGQMVYQDYHYDDQGRLTGLSTYVRAFFEFAGRRALSMDLSESIHPITDGAEDATAWDRVHEGVKRMFLPYQQSTGVLKLALPMLAVIGGFLAGFYFFGPGQLPGEGGSQPIGVGATLLLLAAGGGDPAEETKDAADEEDVEQQPSQIERCVGWIQSVDTKVWIALGICVFVVATVVPALMIAPAATIAFIVALGATILLLPLGSATVISALPGALAEPIAEGWMTIGLKGFRDPVIQETESGEYQISECETLPGVGASPRYRFCKAWVGFTCDVSPESFGEGAIRGVDMSHFRTEAVTDGGETSLPSALEPTEALVNGGHEGVVPSFEAMNAERGSHVFVRTDRWLSRFAEASTGRMTERAQREATKEFAGGEAPFSDRQIMIFGIVGLAVGLGLSFLLWGL